MVKVVALLAVAAVATTAQQFGYPQYGGLAFSSPAYASRGPAYGYQAPQAYGSFGKKRHTLTLKQLHTNVHTR
jgi:hypothetical protein